MLLLGASMNPARTLAAALVSDSNFNHIYLSSFLFLCPSSLSLSRSSLSSSLPLFSFYLLCHLFFAFFRLLFAFFSPSFACFFFDFIQIYFIGPPIGAIAAALSHQFINSEKIDRVSPFLFFCYYVLLFCYSLFFTCSWTIIIKCIQV